MQSLFPKNPRWEESRITQDATEQEMVGENDNQNRKREITGSWG
jgi:hypothetical protein